MKYKELPAFETNEFKEGDKVNLYDKLGILVGEITDISGDYIRFMSTGRNYERHFKQFRKLEEIQPREYIRYIDEFGNLYKYDDTSCFARTESVRAGATKRIKLREVLED